MSNRVVARRYALEVPEGDAPGCVVWRARDLVTNSDMLVTLLAGQRAADTTLAAISELRHRSLAIVLEHGVDGGDCFVITPARTGGMTLRGALVKRPLPGVAEAARIGAQLADALATLHARGLVHGRLSPDTIIVDETGVPRIEDVPAGTLARPALRPADDLRALADVLRASVGAPTGVPLIETAGIPPQFAALVQSLSLVHPPDALSARDALRRFADTPARDLFTEPIDRYGAPPLGRGSARSTGKRLLLGIVSVLAIGVLVLGAIAVATQIDRRDAANRTEQQPIPGPVETIIESAAPTSEIAATELTTVPAQTTTQPQPDAVPTRPRRIEISSVEAIDPRGDNVEHDATAWRAIDRSLSSGWSTEVYKDSGMGGKDGIGLVLRLGVPSRVIRIAVRSVPLGATVAVFADRGVESSGGPEGWDRASNVVKLVRNQMVLRIDRRRITTRLLLWISGMPSLASGFGVTINDVRVFGTPLGA